MGRTFLHSILAKVRSRPLTLSAPHLLRTALHTHLRPPRAKVKVWQETPSTSTPSCQREARRCRHARLSRRRTVRRTPTPKEITWRDIKAIAQKGNTFYRPSASPHAAEHVERRHSASRPCMQRPLMPPDLSQRSAHSLLLTGVLVRQASGDAASATSASAQA